MMATKKAAKTTPAKKTAAKKTHMGDRLRWPKK
jgi:hypothetical protein